MDHQVLIYLAIHAFTTVGAVFGLFIRIEHRLTKLETKMENLEKTPIK